MVPQFVEEFKTAFADRTFYPRRVFRRQEFWLSNQKRQRGPTLRQVSVFRIEPEIMSQPVAIAGSQMSWFIKRRRFVDRRGYSQKRVQDCQQYGDEHNEARVRKESFQWRSQTRRFCTGGFHEGGREQGTC